jgi:tRNA U38,U39,U40 pseudouridine synthase TruA
MMGFLVKVGSNEKTIDEFIDTLTNYNENEDKNKYMAPAEGLFLYDVIYPPLNKIDLDI